MQIAPCDLDSMVRKCVGRGLIWLIEKAESWPLWDDEWIGLIQPNRSRIVTTEIMEYFKANGWCLEVGDNGRIYLAPRVYIKTPEFLYHLTPAQNFKSIRENGLITGEAANKSTSGSMYCRHSIYVCIDERHTRKWADAHLIGKSGCTEWSLLRINSHDLTGGIYRDPASKTGYILDDIRVPYVDLIENIRR